MGENQELPKGWAFERFGDVVHLTAGNPAPQGEEYFSNDGTSFVRVQDLGRMENSVYLNDTKDHVKLGRAGKLKLFPKGSVLFTKSGMSILLNQRAILAKPMYIVSHIGVCIPNDATTSEWIYYWLKTIDFAHLAHATTLPSLQLSKVFELRTPIAPLIEQTRIISKIEELFSELDAGIRVLKNAKTKINIYRHCILKSAFEGKLTANWRQKNKDKMESIEKLLERIKEERKEVMGKKFKELHAVDTAGLPKLPSEWAWVRVKDVISKMQYGTSIKASKNPSGIPVLRMGDIDEGRINYDDLKYLPRDTPGISEYLLSENDVLFNRTNSAERVGKSARFRFGTFKEVVFASYLIKITPIAGSYSPDFLTFYINSLYGRQYIKSVVSQQVGQANVNGTKLGNMPIPLPQYQEQQEIYQEIESRFSQLDQSEKAIDLGLRKAIKLRQSILKTAFEGKLVVQNPKDEPASVLLNKIKNQKKAISEVAYG